MRIFPAFCSWVLIAEVPKANAFGPPFLPHHDGTGRRYTTRSTGDRRLTIIHGSNSDDQEQQHHRQQHHSAPSADIDNHLLVLREFTMPLQADPALYERKVRAKCLREGGEMATVVRWHISRADRETGQARVEAVFLAPSSQGAEASSNQRS